MDDRSQTALVSVGTVSNSHSNKSDMKYESVCNHASTLSNHELNQMDYVHQLEYIWDQVLRDRDTLDTRTHAHVTHLQHALIY